MIAFLILSLVIIVTGLGVISAQNPINSALALIVNMLAIAGMFALLDAEFLAAAQIIVYAGAIMVLVVFVLMLLNMKEESPRKRSPIFIALCAAMGALFLAFGLPVLSEAFRIFPDRSVPFTGSMKDLGRELYTTYVFTFEAASILIMAAIAGAVMLAKRRLR